jgi:hypothetical protein
MKRRVAVAAVCLLAGALVNMGVAWVAVLAWARPADYEFAGATGEDEAWWRGRAPAGIAGVPKVRSVRSVLGARYVMLVALAGPQTRESISVLFFEGGYSMSLDGAIKPALVTWDRAVRAEAGWPMASLGGECWFGAAPGQFDAPPDGWLAGLARPDRQSWAVLVDIPGARRSALLPLRPLFPGFLVNTAIYAVAVALALAAPWALRRFLRRQRGLCPACGYPAGPTGPCSECGGALGAVRAPV